MSLFRPRKLLNVHFPHFLLSAFSHENPALSSNNLRLFVNNGRLFCGGNYFKKNLKKVR